MSRAIVMLSVMVTMLLLASGVALAANQVSCTPPPTDPAADDACYGTSKSDVILGTEFNDRIYGLAGNDIVDGGFGDDFIYGFRGADKLDGGEGFDFIIGGDGNDTLDLRDATVVPTDSYEYADGGNGNDTIYADPMATLYVGCSSMPINSQPVGRCLPYIPRREATRGG